MIPDDPWRVIPMDFRRNRLNTTSMNASKWHGLGTGPPHIQHLELLRGPSVALVAVWVRVALLLAECDALRWSHLKGFDSWTHTSIPVGDGGHPTISSTQFMVFTCFITSNATSSQKRRIRSWRWCVVGCGQLNNSRNITIPPDCHRPWEQMTSTNRESYHGGYILKPQVSGVYWRHRAANFEANLCLQNISNT